MLIEIYIFFQVLAIGLFIASFFTKQEILWTVTAVICGVMMFTSYNVEYYVYAFNSTSGAYDAVATTHSYPYLMALNMLFFVLALLLGIFDLFEKYGFRFLKRPGGSG